MNFQVAALFLMLILFFVLMYKKFFKHTVIRLPTYPGDIPAIQFRLLMVSLGMLNICLFLQRTIIRNAVNAGEQDAIIFVSSGVTGAIYKLIHALNLKKPPVSMILLNLLVKIWILTEKS